MAIVILLSLGVAGGSALAKEPSPLPVLPLRIHIVTTAPSPNTPTRKRPSAEEEAWLSRQVSEANRLMNPHGLRFLQKSVEMMKHSRTKLLTADHRDELASLQRKGSINIFVVQQLKDIDRKNRYISGVHWRLRRLPRIRYVVLSMKAGAMTLAHELGHYFGNPHSPIDNNIMSYKRSDPSKVRFNAAQGRVLRTHARMALRKKELVPPKELCDPKRRPKPSRPQRSCR